MQRGPATAALPGPSLLDLMIDMHSGSCPMLKLFSIFAAVFVAELEDKRQLATPLFASDREFKSSHATFPLFLRQLF